MIEYLSKEEPLKSRIQQIQNSQNLDSQRELIRIIAADLKIDSLTCAAALVYLTQAIENTSTPAFFGNNKTGNELPTKNPPLGLKMVRYRLDVGTKHRITWNSLQSIG